MKYPIALTIAGSDSGGGAGVQADLKTFRAFEVYGCSAITGVTAQNTLGVFAIQQIPADIVRAQIDAVATDLAPAATKTGMLANAATIEVAAESIRAHSLANVVVDPVLVATSGERLVEADAEDAFLRQLVPLATLLTPNLDEAAALVGKPVRDRTEMSDAARCLVEAGASAVLVKGGHLPGNVMRDLLFDGQDELFWERERIDTTATHGSGCTLSAAIAAGLAHGRPLRDAIEQAIDFTARAIRHAPDIGSGNGPLNHFLAPKQDA